ncbi:MAG: hypothetical protein AAF211_10800 [Myxococcota bacterium]
MSNGVFIFVDDEYSRPLYADPDPDEVDSELFDAIRESITDAIEEEGGAKGSRTVGEVRYSWNTHLKSGLSFVAFAEDLPRRRLDRYLKLVSQRYFDEVDDVRSPDRAGVEDVVVDVIPPWEETDEELD